METIEAREHAPIAPPSEPVDILIAEYAIAVFQRRIRLAIITGIGMLCFIIYTLRIPNEYVSEAQLMPPDAQALSIASPLADLSNIGLSINAGGGLWNESTPSDIAIGILGSTSIQDAIINRLNLRNVYKSKLNIDAKKALLGSTAITVDKRSGIITIKVTDDDPGRARDIVQAYINELDRRINDLSTSSAHRQRIFLEQELKSVKAELAANTEQLGQFSSRNATIDPEHQGEATVNSAARLQEQLINAESELSALKSSYTEDNFRVRAAQSRITELQSQLQKIRGSGDKVETGDTKSDSSFPSLGKLPLLGITYADLYRQVETQKTVYETLTKDYELAKVEEAQAVQRIDVLSAPDVPERKVSPHRTMIVLFGTFVTLILSIGVVIARKAWELSSDSLPLKAAWRAFRAAL